MPPLPTANETEQKLARMERYLAADPGNLSLLTTIIDLCLELGRHEAAQGHIAAALALNAEDADILHRQALLLMEQGALAQAAQIWEKLLTRVSDVGLATNLAFIYQQQGRQQAAADLLANYATPDIPSQALTLYIRALHHVGKLEQALALVQQHLPRCAGDHTFLAAASLLCMDGDQKNMARELSAAALAAGSRPLEAVVTVGTLALEELDAEVAQARFGEAVQLNPRDGRSWSGLGLASLLRQDFAGADQELQQAIHYMPGHIGTLHAAAWCRLLSQDLDGAKRYFEQSLDLDRNFSESHGGMAVVYALQGQRAQAEEAIRRAQGLDRGCLSARFAQMVLSGILQHPDQFKRIAMKILSTRDGVDGLSMAEMLTRFISRQR